MRSAQIRRHLGAMNKPLPQTGSPKGLMAGVKMLSAEAISPTANSHATSFNLEFSPRDYVTYLLSIDAEIEHCLMVQYLYGAYSLGGPQVPEAYRDIVRDWQEVILGIAKEEMGHLISVQNSLRLIGSPLHMEREDYPWDVPFYPFPFALEPLTLDSLAKYVFAESPVDWDGGALGKEIRARVHAQTDDPHQVSELFNTLIPLVQNPEYLPDTVFQANTYPAQANWAEWGRGYQGGNRGNSSGQPRQTPDVLVVPQTCRDDMVSALQAIAYQGEATTGSTKSHFVRFLRIYIEMRELLGLETLTDLEWSEARPADYTTDGWQKLQPASKAGLLRSTFVPWSPSRKVAINPYVSLDPDLEPELESQNAGAQTSRITHPESILWAQLHNVRYRMLLTYLIHSFTLFGGLNAAGAITPRGAIVNGSFGEMYNLRAISEILMQSPLSAKDASAGFAGPPFQMPYTLNSPLGEANRWRGHLDLLAAADSLVKALLHIAPPSRHIYLTSMREADQNMRALALRILSGSIDAALI
ncbi:ferritin-like domain-containing protein [Undibacterium sp. Di26W]|uniref:ferritin-like domain-containing protein n=1 Tax=Undibacterium sp. Di26W TaxID=3413035 RepID=UPI003BEF6A7E